MRVCIVKSGELFDPSKNNKRGMKFSLLPETIMDNPAIKKYCPICGSELTPLTIYEKGEETDILDCRKCSKIK
jgi:hypothetical protein